MKAVHLLIHGFFLFGQLGYMGMYVFLSQGKSTGLQTAPSARGIEPPALVLICLACGTILVGVVWPRFFRLLRASSIPAFLQRIAPQPGASIHGTSLLNTIITDAFFETATLMGLIGIYVGMAPVASWTLMACSFLATVLNTRRVLQWLPA